MLKNDYCSSAIVYLLNFQENFVHHAHMSKCVSWFVNEKWNLFIFALSSAEECNMNFQGVSFQNTKNSFDVHGLFDHTKILQQSYIINLSIALSFK